MENVKVGDVVRIKHWEGEVIFRQVKEVDIRYHAVRCCDGEVYMMCNEEDEEGVFFF